MVGGVVDDDGVRLQEIFESGACDGFDILPAVLPVDIDVLVEAVVPLLRRRRLRCRLPYRAQGRR